MTSAPPAQLFVRNAEGKVWGPLAPASVRMLLEDGRLAPPIQVSADGLTFGPPDSMAGFASAVPRELWSRSRPKQGFAPPVLNPVQAAGAPAAPAITPATSVAAPDAIASEGDLSKKSVARLYALAAAHDVSGLFSFELPGRILWVHFKKGTPERIESSHADDGVGAFLMQHGQLTREALAQAEAEKGRFGGEVIGALFGLGLVNPSTAFGFLGQRAAALLARTFSTSEGHFTFSAQELPPQQALPLGQRWSILTEAMRRATAPDLLGRLSDVRALPVMKSGGIVQVSELRLTPQETRAYSFIDGVRSLDGLMTDFANEADTFIRLVFLLRELDVVSFAAVRNPTAAARSAPTPPPPHPVEKSAPAAPAPSPPVAAKPAAAKPAAPAPAPAPSRPAPPPAGAKPQAPASAPPAPAPMPAAPVDLDAELIKVRDAVGKLKEKNHFQILGITESADSGAVKVAYFKLAKTYHPDTVPPHAPADLGKLKAEMFAAIGDAYRVLGDDTSRAQYLSDLKTGGAEKIDVATLLAAEDMFQKGTLLFKSRRYDEALAHFDEAIGGNPEEGEFYAWRGYTRFLLTTDKKRGAQEADKDLKEAVKRNPRCAPAHYFLGLLAKAGGDNAAAKKHFQHTIEVNPQHIDAQRELRLLNSKK